MNLNPGATTRTYEARLPACTVRFDFKLIETTPYGQNTYAVTATAHYRDPREGACPQRVSVYDSTSVGHFPVSPVGPDAYSPRAWAAAISDVCVAYSEAASTDRLEASASHPRHIAWWKYHARQIEEHFRPATASPTNPPHIEADDDADDDTDDGSEEDDEWE